MLFIITWNENAEAVSASKSRPDAGGSAADWNSRGHEPGGAGRVERAPHAARDGRRQQQGPGDEQQHRALREPAPVAAAEERPHGRAPARARVDRGARPQHERLEAGDERIAGIATAREREIRGGRAVEAAEPPHALGAQALRPVARALERRLELRPGRTALRREALRAHFRTPPLRQA